MNQAAQLGPQTIKWWPDWRGQIAAIIGAGPSAATAGIDQLRSRCRVIAVNTSFQLVPWADILYSCDYAWWQQYKGCPEFAGLRLTHDRRACNEFAGLQRVEIERPNGDDLLLDRPTWIGAGGNSGFQALNLAVQFGAIRILLIGIDCHLQNGAHWHGRHPYKMNNPAESNVKRWRKAFDGAAGKLQSLGIDVINCSAQSALCNYPKLTIPAALERWGL
jgi:hypothetical protein